MHVYPGRSLTLQLPLMVITHDYTRHHVAASVQTKDKASNVWVWDNPQETSSQWVLEANIPVARSSGISLWSLPQQQLELHVICFSNERLLVMSCTDEKKLEVKKPPFDIGEISDSNPWSHFRAQKTGPKTGPHPVAMATPLKTAPRGHQNGTPKVNPLPNRHQLNRLCPEPIPRAAAATQGDHT